MLMGRPNTAPYAAVISSLVDPMRGPILPRKLSAFGMPRRVVRRRDRSGNRSGRLLAHGACVEGRERDHGASCVASAPSRAGGSASFSRSAKGMSVRRSMRTARSRPSAISPYSLVRPMPPHRRAQGAGGVAHAWLTPCGVLNSDEHAPMPVWRRPTFQFLFTSN